MFGREVGASVVPFVPFGALVGGSKSPRPELSDLRALTSETWLSCASVGRGLSLCGALVDDEFDDAGFAVVAEARLLLMISFASCDCCVCFLRISG